MFIIAFLTLFLKILRLQGKETRHILSLCAPIMITDEIWLAYHCKYSYIVYHIHAAGYSEVADNPGSS
jgi:hypothetical protein